MHYLLILILFNFTQVAFADENARPAPKKVNPSVDQRSFDKLQKDLKKRYGGEEGQKRLEQDVEKRVIEVIEKIKEENENKPGLKPLVKAADDLLKKDSEGNSIGLKKLNDFQKELDSRFENYKKQIEKKKTIHKKVESSPAPFDYQLAQQEELREKNHEKKRALPIGNQKEEKLQFMAPTFWKWGGLILLLIVMTWMGWRKWR